MSSAACGLSERYGACEDEAQGTGKIKEELVICIIDINATMVERGKVVSV